MEVVARIVGGIKLDDEVDSWNLTNSLLISAIGAICTGWRAYIETTSGDVGTNQGTAFSIAKLEESVGAFLLLLLPVEIEDVEIDVVQELGVVFDRVAAAEEDDNLFFLHLFQEGEEKKEPLVGVTYDIALFEALHRAMLGLLTNIDIQRSRLEGDACEILNLGGLGCGEEHGLPLGREDLDDLSYLVLKTNL